MSDPFDAVRFELERLIRIGRETLGPPSPRQLLTARMLDPAAWSVNAEEHIAWCMHHGLTSSTSHFGGQYLISRRIALIKAAELLRRLDRQATGMPDLEPFDPRAMSARLEKQAFEISRTDRRRHVTHKAARAVFSLKDAQGVPEPTPAMAEDGSVTLTWSEGGRSAIVSIDVEGNATMSIPGSDTSPLPLVFDLWRGDGARRIVAVTDWIHFDGMRPDLTPTQAPTGIEAA